ncbi:hypothetical protein RRF56_22530 [Nodosilinea sp. E11]|nr:hypothetical protein [Nodosilinea sp. E11]WOD38986.1 hypothetical protein RRF56_22530 [Nodosilinea sp. E11]
MVYQIDSPQAVAPADRLTLQAAAIAADSTVIRCLGWARDRCAIEFELRNGTTYNSFRIQAEKTAPIATSHGKFKTQCTLRLADYPWFSRAHAMHPYL